jgi:hypothetical protein
MVIVYLVLMASEYCMHLGPLCLVL